MWHSNLFTAVKIKLWVAEEKENRLKGDGFLDPVNTGNKARNPT